ncbi:MAG: signal peptide peptidase SppA [Deltaproteobacteria bacterium]|nr:signal peptide peptidase SppA [Deltaproteobacteria bacterium]
MKRIIVRLLAAIGAATVVFMLLGILSMSLLLRRLTGDGIPAKTVLELNLEHGLIEYVPEDRMVGIFSRRAPTLRDVTDALEEAARDKRVVAVLARVGSHGLGLAQIQEVRGAVAAFRESGKPTIAYAETFGEAGPGTGAYYLATAFEHVYLQPSGDVGLSGLIVESPFIRGTLDKIGLEPRFAQRREYKNAMNVFTERKFTPPHREATQKVIDSQFGQIVRGIAEARSLSDETVRALVSKGPLTGQLALDNKLIDGLAYRDEVVATLKEKFGKDIKPLSFTKYVARTERPHEQGDTIALIYGVGAVQRGKGGYDPMSGSVSMGADSVTAAFRAAVEGKDVKAILFRIDSPGGSYVASDTIWRETLRAKEAGKPVIASMGNVAGSGGYFVAMAADKIVAQPGTITGSIGVLSGKMLTNKFWDKVGVSWDEVHTTENALLWTSRHDYSPAQWTQFEASLDRIYDDFTSKAAQGRNLPKEKILAAAKGRIWTGEDAKTLGLVDELGGLSLALHLAKEAAGITADTDVQLEVFPREKPSLRQVLMERLFEDETEEEEDMAMPTDAFVQSMQKLQPLLRLVHQLGLTATPGVLSMPEVEPVQ